MIPKELSIDNISKVYDLIKPYITLTPLFKANDYINNLFNTKLFFKCEFFQKSGSFKARGVPFIPQGRLFFGFHKVLIKNDYLIFYIFKE